MTCCERELVTPSDITGRILSGRTADVDVLDDLVQDVADGSGRVCVLRGAAGIGVTSLVDVLARAAQARHLAVRRGVLAQIDARRPFGVLRAWTFAGRGDAVDGGFASLADRSRSRGRAERHDMATVTILDDLLTLVRDWCAEGPAALVLDGAHRVDPLSVLALSRLATLTRSVPLLLVVAGRPPAAASEADRLIRCLVRGGATVLDPAPLAESDAHDVLRRLAGVCNSRRVLDLAPVAGGNPGDLVELARLAAGDQPVDGPAVRAMAARRLVGLAAEDLDLLMCAAALGVTFTVSDLCRASGRSVLALLPALRAAIERKVLVDNGSVVRFGHPAIRAAASRSADAATTVRYDPVAVTRPPEPVTLTETERRVAALVAAGLSNPAIAARLFLSRRTVGTHVSSVLRKLGLASRVELAVGLSRQPRLIA